MKKYLNKLGIFILVILILGLVGCKRNPQEDVKDPINNQEEQGEELVESEKNREKIMTDFEAVFSTKEVDKLVDFVAKNIGKVTSIEGDKMVVGLEDLLETSIDSLTDNLLDLDTTGKLMEIAETELFFPEDKIGDIEDENLREEVEKLYKNKYKLVNLEGQFYPIVDYERFKEYYGSLSEELKDYYEIKRRESNEITAIDGGLNIGYDELADKIIQVENYIQKYSHGQKYEEVLSLYRSWLYMYLNGLPNTPIYDHSTGKIHDDIMESYIETSNTKDSATGIVVGKYLKLINENDTVIDRDIFDKVLSLVNEALSLLEVTK